jgi:uncharacterized protein (UPF0332 family)
MLIIISIGISIPVLINIQSRYTDIDSNGFKRTFKGNSLTYIKSIKKEQDIYRIAGHLQDKIYFARLLPGLLYETNLQLDNLKPYSITQIPATGHHVSYQCIIDSTNIYFSIGNFKKIYSTNLISRSPINSISSEYVFTRSAVLSPSSFVFRCFQGKNGPLFIKKKSSVIQTYYKDNGEYAKMDPSGIITDGLLQYDKTTSSLLYSYFYQSNILVLDTNLSFRGFIPTIDQLNKNKTKSGLVNNDKNYQLYTNITPHYFINTYSYTYGGQLYLVSAIQSNDENATFFNNNTVVDVYNIDKRQYGYSFYIPLFNGEKVKEFMINRDNLIAMYKTNIVLFHLGKTNSQLHQ